MKEVFENIKEKIKNQPIEQFVDTNGNWDLVQTVLDCCCEAVDRVKEEYNNGWIPVEKTLPKKSGYYTVTEEQYSLDMRKKMGVRVSHKVQFDAEEQRWHRAKFLKVIAWKEHETPYQPKGE